VPLRYQATVGGRGRTGLQGARACQRATRHGAEPSAGSTDGTAGV